MRVYLDTNILAFIVGMDKGNSINADIRAIIKDYDTTLLSSNICALELLHLIQIGKISVPNNKDIRKASVAAFKVLEQIGVTFVPFNEKHIKEMIDLPLYDDHRDPNDRMVIAQSISDRIPLISSDRKFSRYERYGLDFIFLKSATIIQYTIKGRFMSR